MHKICFLKHMHGFMRDSSSNFLEIFCQIFCQMVEGYSIGYKVGESWVLILINKYYSWSVLKMARQALFVGGQSYYLVFNWTPHWIQRGQEEFYRQQEWGLLDGKLPEDTWGAREIWGKPTLMGFLLDTCWSGGKKPVRYQGWGRFTKLTQQDLGWNWMKPAKDRAQGWSLVRKRPWNRLDFPSLRDVFVIACAVMPWVG